MSCPYIHQYGAIHWIMAHQPEITPTINADSPLSSIHHLSLAHQLVEDISTLHPNL